ncbi:hypothetical protein SERLA73DRAFT_133651 [Serpula lacrymans var. lacrymans S7.3]|uniref:Glycopeptide n=2 Tax=Serpula lacrymans var. lacrymans TaxID=341189 RepID=F8PS09_SERL3|nr:uncharacterized protein SERLADRAFT_384613 [Serpula lacrymans var. lacrymans S7.9]EGO00675.1 hypothetical protein SERLA73DRAFT_133651 [Serpula lacrymans var. lacrymans S7.3]EGO26227.1 hypothetical protein SERLADRAFT_384613 [Serpula lacrymans var. lacrymans S7.9]
MFTNFKSFAVIVAAAAALAGVQAQESHTVTFNNQCKKGTPTLVQGGKILSTGQPYKSNGPLVSAIAYLQTGPCGLNGESCTLIETTLQNPTTPGSGSSSDISLIVPHTFSVTSGFQYNNGCTGKADCNNANCPEAFHQPNDTTVQVACQAPNAGLVINFCA